MTSKEAKELVFSLLNAANETLAVKDRVQIDMPATFSNFKFNHQRCHILVFYRGSGFAKSETTDIIKQDRDIEIGIMIGVRINQKSKDPEEYLEFVIDALSGQVVNDDRPDNMIYCLSDEYLDEESSDVTLIKWHGVTFAVPATYLELSLRT